MEGQRVRSLQFPDRFSSFSVIIVSLPVPLFALLVTKPIGMPALISLFLKRRKKLANIRWLNESRDSFTVLYATLIMVRNKLTSSALSHIDRQSCYTAGLWGAMLPFSSWDSRKGNVSLLSQVLTSLPIVQHIEFRFPFPTSVSKLCPLTFKVLYLKQRHSTILSVIRYMIFHLWWLFKSNHSIFFINIKIW